MLSKKNEFIMMYTIYNNGHNVGDMDWYSCTPKSKCTKDESTKNICSVQTGIAVFLHKN